MRHLVTNIEEGREVGRRAREEIERKYSQKVVAETVVERLEKIVKRERESASEREKKREKESESEKEKEKERKKDVNEEEEGGGSIQLSPTAEEGGGGRITPRFSRHVKIQQDKEKPDFPHPFRGEYPYQIDQ